MNILGFSLPKLVEIFEQNGFSKLDAKRVFPWLHIKLAKTFDEMSDVPQKVRQELKEKFSISVGQCEILQKSSDGTQKALLKLEDGNLIETVFIPEEKRNTICVSSQVGCAMGCKFCHTGTQGFIRNLSAGEIMSQVIFWKRKFPISNIVFMGMGEPLLNYENLSAALELLLAEKIHNFSRTKITVSTCGILGGQLQQLAKFGVKLAVSLHAPNDNIRSQLMPINRKYNIVALLPILKEYKKSSNTEYITFEYLLLKDVNDSAECAEELAKVLKNFPVKVNLIPYNDWPDSKFHRSTQESIDKFFSILFKHKIRVTTRKARGTDILAACGQLKSKSKRKD